MLKLTFGLWQKRDTSDKWTGTFSILGKKFVVFMDENKSDKPNAPQKTLTIMESLNDAS